MLFIKLHDPSFDALARRPIRSLFKPTVPRRADAFEPSMIGEENSLTPGRRGCTKPGQVSFDSATTFKPICPSPITEL